MYNLNEQQLNIYNWIVNSINHTMTGIYEYAGRAGTGKTYLLQAICNGLRLSPNQILPMAYTGAAANILRQKGFYNATTLHSGLFTTIKVPNPDYNIAINKYRQCKTNNMNNNIPHTILKYIPKTKLDNIKLIIIDEGYMCPMYMKSIIESHNIPIIVTGDCRQLKPIGDNPAYLYNEDIPELTQVMRQNEASPIIYIANRILDDKPIHTGIYGNKVLVIEDNEYNDNMLKMADLVLCATNNTREYINKHIREDIYHRYSKLPEIYDKLICRRNNHSIESNGIELSNGLIGYCNTILGPDNVNNNYFTIDFITDITHIPFYDLRCDRKYFESNINTRKYYRDTIGSGERFEYAYCITTHLSQGTEANRGVFFEEYINDIDTRKRLAYTAITRFKEMVIYIKPHKRYY